MMSEPISITVSLTINPGDEAEAEAAADAIATSAATITGFAMTRDWAPGGVLALSYRGDSQAAVDQHLADHGTMYARFSPLGAVDRVSIGGPVDDATVAAFGRLSPSVVRV